MGVRRSFSVPLLPVRPLQSCHCPRPAGPTRSVHPRSKEEKTIPRRKKHVNSGDSATIAGTFRAFVVLSFFLGEGEMSSGSVYGMLERDFTESVRHLTALRQTNQVRWFEC